MGMGRLGVGVGWGERFRGGRGEEDSTKDSELRTTVVEGRRRRKKNDPEKCVSQRRGGRNTWMDGSHSVRVIGLGG